MEKSIVVIILNFNSWQRTLEEINMLIRVLAILPQNILVVDNASPNDSYEQLKKKQVEQGFRLIKSEQNLGYAAGNNIGLRYARKWNYQYAWILNNDIFIDNKDIIEKILQVFEKDNQIAVVSPDIYSPKGHLFNRDSKCPTFWDFTFGMLLYSRIGREIDDQGGYGYVYRPQGCCMILDLDKMKDVGDFDEHTFLYCEEIILAERLKKKGYRCACCISESVIHDHSSTVKDTYKKRKIRQIKQESFRYYLEEYRKYSGLKIKLVELFYILKLFLLKN